MPDPIEELENFTSPGLSMTPMTASEVRRRGTRMRRRNIALATAGGVAAVAVIATPIAVLAGNQGSSKPEPAPAPDVTWIQEVPQDFDLTAGLPAGTPQRDVVAFDVPGICGDPAWAFDLPEPAVDAVGARDGDPGTDGGTRRALILYADAATASSSLSRLGESVDSCPTDPNGTGAPLVNDVVSADDDSLVFTQQAKDGELLYDLTAYQVEQSGNALYLASSHTAAGGVQVADTEVRRLEDASTPVVAQLCVFSATGCGTGDTVTDSGSGSSPATVIPDDFPLLDGLPTEKATEDFGRFGPSRSRKGLGLTGCGGAALATPDHADLMVGGWHDPAEARERQLITFANAQDAQAYVDRVGTLLTCSTEHSSDGVDTIRSGSETDLGDQSVVFVTWYAQDGAPAVAGFRVTQAVRVGNAVLVSDRINDGAPTRVTGTVVDDLAHDSDERLTDVVDAMAPYAG